MRKAKAILSIFLAVFLCLGMSGVTAAQSDFEDVTFIREVYFTGYGEDFDYLEVEPGENVELYVAHILVPVWSPREAHDEIVVGFEDEPLDCLTTRAFEDVDNGLSSDVYDRYYEVTAPTEPGTYFFYKVRTNTHPCSAAEDIYRNYPLLREVIATVKVIAEEEDKDEWRIIYYAENSVTNYKFPYSITFLQRGQKIRIEIDTDKFGYLYDGSATISVEEDIWINYGSGMVSRRDTNEDEFYEIKVDPSEIWAIKSALLLAGLIPGVGTSLSVVDYWNEVVEPEKSVDKYVKHDKTNKPNGMEYDLHKYFEWAQISNDRDIVVIPWHKHAFSLRMRAVRIDCPTIQFPEDGSRDIVFRINCVIEGETVRHDIAIPIEFQDTDNLPI